MRINILCVAVIALAIFSVEVRFLFVMLKLYSLFIFLMFFCYSRLTKRYTYRITMWPKQIITFFKGLN